ncbi:MAG: hypothetical protein L0Y57_04450 [Beijerinckiaceae bacterium]|nr:hypothetical protein [Beijerinckiaceae bacterium]
MGDIRKMNALVKLEIPAMGAHRQDRTLAAGASKPVTSALVRILLERRLAVLGGVYRPA